MISNKKNIDVVHIFDIIKDRLDNFYVKILNQSHIHLYEVVKLCLILSYEKARVESGFSIDSEIIGNNLQECSLVLLRTVYEGIMKEGGIMKVHISNEMIDYVSRTTLSSGTEREQRKTQKLFEKKRLERKKVE